MDKVSIKKGRMKMGENSSIAWTDHTFNPWVGCFKVSDGCKNCYAETQMTRKPRWANTWGPPALTERLKTSDDNWKKPEKWNKEAEELGIRYKVFCASLADVFEDNPVLDDWRVELFQLIDKTPSIDWLLLTKRPEHVDNKFLLCAPGTWVGNGSFPSNVSIGVSVESNKSTKRMVEIVSTTVNIQRLFVSMEPMLESIELNERVLVYFDWIIVGGESGSNHRPFKWDWARDIRDQCQSAGVAFFMKQGAGKSQAHMPEIPADLMIREFPQ